MSKISAFIRTAVLAAIVIIASFMCGLKLLQIQIADGEMYLALTRSTYTAEQDIEAARGRISDRNGVILNTNELSYSINLQKSSLMSGTENEIIFRVLTILIKNGEEWNESLPISKTAPYSFLHDKEKQIDTLRSELNLGVYATVDNCMHEMYKVYEISEHYEEQMRRYIAGVRYEMQIKDFSYDNKYVLAKGISEKTVLELKELGILLPGVDITEDWSRVYKDGELASHIRGTVGAISADEYAKLKASGYTMNDIIGLSGVELALEDTLRGERGIRTITRSSDGKELEDEITKAPVAGNSVRLTIDTKFQSDLQEILEHYVNFMHSPHYTQDDRGKECTTGAVVVLDVKTGGVLGMASYPNYDINDLIENYEAVLTAEDSPIFNRALSGVFRPGSTFKTITATAGLAEGVITDETGIYCGGTYYYYGGGFTPHCHLRSGHGNLDVEMALRHSCNIFFYDTARLLGIDRLSHWAARFGVGTDLGFELNMENGQMTSIELYEKLGLTWNNGDIVQAGIGQSETLLTPLHMAVQAMTIANRGVRYRPHIVEAVYNYDYTELISETKPEVVEDMSMYSDVFDTVTEGMIKVSDAANFIVDGMWVNIYDYKKLPGKVATKTGTPQKTTEIFNSAIIGFYPADKPEIAFGILMEEGEYSRHIASNLVGAYVYGDFNPLYDEDGNALDALDAPPTLQ